MSEHTIDLWVSGSYEATVRPRPKARAMSTFIRETVPITIKALDKAPVVIRTRENGVERALLGHSGRLWRPLTHYSSPHLTVEQFAELTHEQNFRSPLPHSGRARVREETEGVILSDSRHLFEKKMQSAANDIIVIAGIVHEAAVEPRITLSWEAHKHITQIGLAHDKHISAYAALNLADHDAAIRAATLLSQLDHDCEVVSSIEDIWIGDEAPLAFDAERHAVNEATNFGTSGIAMRNLSRLSHETIQAFLDLRKLRNQVDADFSMVRNPLSIVAEKLPKEHLEPLDRDLKMGRARTLLGLGGTMGWGYSPELDLIADIAP